MRTSNRYDTDDDGAAYALRSLQPCRSSLTMMMPVASAPSFPSPMVVEQSPLIQTASLPMNADFDHFIGQQLQATLERRLRSHSVPSTKSARQHNCAKTGPATFTRSETEKLIDQLNLTDPTCNLDYYEEQVGDSSMTTRYGPLCPPYRH